MSGEGASVAVLRSRGINPGVRHVAPGTDGCAYGNGAVYALFQLPQGQIPAGDVEAGILYVLRETPIMEGAYEIGWGSDMDNICPAIIGNARTNPVVGLLDGKVKVYMPGTTPTSLGSVWAEALPDVRPDATPRDPRILAFYDRSRTPVEKLVKRFDETGKNPEGYRMRYADKDALLQMEELLPTRDPDVLRNFEARRIFR